MTIFNQYCLHELFEQQADKTPHHIALTFQGETMSYQELNVAANQLARYLKKQGVGPNVLVGLQMQRSLSLIVCLLGILKAGGAYVPFDASCPLSRVNSILQDSTAPLLLTDNASLPRHALPGKKILMLEDILQAMPHESSTNLATDTFLNNIAYVIYTSGSTGNPKGVLISHAQVNRLFTSTFHWFHFSEKDVWSLFHSVGFDFSTWEIWGALLFGGKLVIVPQELTKDIQSFYKMIAMEGVTILNITPTVFTHFAAEDTHLHDTHPLNLRYIIFGGEAFHAGGLKEWYQHHADDSPQLINMYGITETTVHVTYCPVTSAYLDTGHGIGVPLPDLKIYLVDEYLHPVPQGTPGEIIIAGAGLAQGYLGNPALTASTFIPNPFADCPGDRCYKSGDLGCYLLDGTLIYLGRRDNQVKLRGFRIELGEIEKALIQLPSITSAAVILREDTPGLKQLVAYLVSDAKQGLDEETLRKALQQGLPDYMIPSVFMFMETLPFTLNGKIDKQRLPAPHSVNASLNAREDTPPSWIEEIVTDLWSGILRINVIKRTDSFFYLGGHSLLLAKMLSNLQETFGVSISAHEFFEAPTIAALSNIIHTKLLNASV